MKRTKNLKEKILYHINKSKHSVFLRSDFKKLGTQNQISRVLNNLIKDKEIIRIGYGLYAKSEISPLNREVIPIKNLPELAREALNRLGIKTGISKLEKDYNQGRTNQVPTGRLIRVKKKTTRKIGYDERFVSYELN
jgi:hypothetical protein